jgi:intracellular multiplication protein IcmO
MAIRRKRRGLEAKHEPNQQQIIRDTRSLGHKISDFLRHPKGAAAVVCAAAVFAFIVYGLSDLSLIIGVGVYLYCGLRHPMLPFRLPKIARIKDYNDLAPGTDKPRMARGIYYFGNEDKTSDELWFANEDMRTHVLFFGSTGSGKTETLISLAYNALLQSSGFIYVDGKGDNTLYAKMFAILRYMGREDDLLVINFMTGARDIIGPQEKRLSNTMNPFATGSSSMLAQLVISLMDDSSESSDGDMWKGRAIAFVEALMKILVAMRDSGYILLDANTVRNYFHLARLEAMVLDNTFIRDGQESIDISFLPDNIVEPIKNYLYNLPGFNPDRKGKQVSQVLEQHGFITMQLTRVFSSLADTYGHILRTKLAEVDLKDVVLNRRILVVLLPALEKSPSELSNLGKIIIASLRVMMASGLGDSVEGEYADLVDSKPTNAETPYLCILDEYGYYAVDGFAVVPAQARSLGFSVVFSGQDLPAFQKASKEEAASIGANTNIKICMKLEDPMETWEFFMKTAGESYVSHVESFQVDMNSIASPYQDAKSARLEKRSRVDLLDLKEQREGEAHIFFKSKIIRARMFYANPPKIKTLRVNHFVKVDRPSDTVLAEMSKKFREFAKRMNDDSIKVDFNIGDEEVRQVASILQGNEEKSIMARAMAALHGSGKDTDLLANFFGEDAASADDLSASFAQGDSNDSRKNLAHLDIFTQMNLAEHLKGVVITSDMPQFQKPMLDKAMVRDQLEYLERLCGKESNQAVNISLELLRDMKQGTEYPPKLSLPKTPKDLANDIDELISIIKKKKDDVNKEQRDNE